MSQAMDSRSPLELAYHQAAGVRNRYEEELRKKANVLGVGVGMKMREGKPTGEVAIVVLVKEKVPSDQLMPDDVVPDEIEGIPVDVHVIGDLSAYS